MQTNIHATQTIQTTQQQLNALASVPIEDLAYSNLLAYAALMQNDYDVAPHIALVADHLMAVERGDITRLMIFLPPRHGKTMLTSEFFPAWFLGRNPEKQIIAATYSFDRAGDVGRKVRNQAIDPIYKEIFPECHVSADSKSASKLGTLQGGNYFSVGVGGATVGRGAHLFLIDDPLKSRADAESEITQRRLRDWFQSVAYTRLMPGKSGIILIMTRWSYYDLAGYLLAEQKHENWTVINLPAIAEDNDEIGRTNGEAIWPSRYPVPILNNIKKTVGTREWNSQYQQRPLPEEGGMVKLDWFKRYTFKEHRDIDLNSRQTKSEQERTELLARQTAIRMLGRTDVGSTKFIKIVASWDTAFKESQLNDPSACTVWGVTNSNLYYLLWVINQRLEFPELVKKVIEVHERNKNHFNFSAGQCPVLVEDRASGQSLIQELKRYTSIPVIAIKADANKQVRLSETTSIMEAGRVWLPESAVWLVDYETQICQFPYSKFDDMVDSTSQFLRWAGGPRFVKSKEKLFWK